MSKKRCYLAVLAGLTAIPLFAADGWVSGEKHFYRSRKVPVTPEWQRYTFEFKTPELARFRGVLRIQITPAGDCNWLQIKDAALKMENVK